MSHETKVPTGVMAVNEASKTDPTIPDRAKALRRRKRKQAFSAYRFLTPWFLGLILIVLGPMLASLYLSFTRFELIGTPDWIGTKNYERMFTDDTRFLHSVQATLLYSVVSVPAILIFSLLLAVFLNHGIRFLSVYRSLFYIPSLLGGSVAIAVLWLEIFGREGLVNDVLKVIGIDHGSWVGDPSTALGTVVVLATWTFGSTMVIFLAGLRQIPQSYYEAARVDGANAWQRFWSITFPMLTPVIFFNGLLTIVHSFQSFTPAFVISGGTGQPADSLLLYTVYLYQRGFVDFQMGYASALAWALLAVLGLIAGFIFWSSRFWVYYGEES
nr:sugar ABC transporter permease [Pseudarthrobacter phenanthrenivorans]